MEITTKHDIGEKVFWLDWHDGIYKINYDPITSINIGGKNWEKYTISYTTRGDGEVWNDFEEARKVALEKQQEKNDRAVVIIQEYRNTGHR